MWQARSPRTVACFLALLILPQAAAFLDQFARGFRPFGPAPVRVPLSWDMFAVRIERCALNWSPPVRTPLGTLSSLHDLSPMLEWDLVSDSAESYRFWARWGCRFAKPPTRVSLSCFYPDGREEHLGFDCH